VFSFRSVNFPFPSLLGYFSFHNFHVDDDVRFCFCFLHHPRGELLYFQLDAGLEGVGNHEYGSYSKKEGRLIKLKRFVNGTEMSDEVLQQLSSNSSSLDPSLSNKLAKLEARMVGKSAPQQPLQLAPAASSIPFTIRKFPGASTSSSASDNDDGEEFSIQPNPRSNNWDELQTRKRKIGNEANSAAVKNTSKDLPMVYYERFQEEEKQAHLVVSYKFLTYAPHDWLTWTCALAVVDLGKQVDYLIWSHDNMGEGFFFVQALILFADGRLD
jgi:hypothetical protein